MPAAGSLDFDDVVIFPVIEPGRGGIGQHVSQLRDHLESKGTNVQIGPSQDQTPRIRRRDPWKWQGRSPEKFLDDYDRWCADSQTFDPQIGAVMAIPGAALRTFRAVPPGVKKILVSTSIHAPTHRAWAMEAIRRAPLERSWLTARLVEKMEREAEIADVVVSNSSLTTRTFVDAGHPEEKFALVSLRARELAPVENLDDPVDIVYMGALTVEKGVVDLIRVFSGMRDPKLRLRLMGGPRSPGMKAFLRRAVARDDRLRVSIGDPGRQLPTARLLVHPSYADSFSYSVAEGIASGLPVITTDRVGASELITEGHSHPKSRVVRAGDRRWLARAIADALGTN